MQKKTIASLVVLAVPLSLLLLLVSTHRTQALQEGDPPVQALVLSDLGAYQDIVTSMQGQGWNVTTAVTLEVLTDDPDAFASYDVVWVPAETNYPNLLHFVNSGALAVFTKQGGTAVVWGLSPDTLWLDIAPGGADAEPLPTGTGPVVITAAAHPMISGAGTGGVALSDVDLDPYAAGGGGCVLNTPDTPNTVVIIAENTVAPVIVEYSYGDGHVVICALVDELDACRENVLLYVQSLVQ